MITQVLWLSGAAVGLTIWIYRHRLLGSDDLGSVSVRWLHEFRSDTHHRR
jgi:hypothetical protein